MKCVIVTGMSGAGKSQALKFFEDMGYFCVDNLPPQLLPKFAEICALPGNDIDKVAIGIDIRGGKLFDDLDPALSELININVPFYILFLDAKDEVLLKRFKETRRLHPLSKNDRLSNGIEEERALLTQIKSRADFIIDTSHLLTRELREKMTEIFIENRSFNSLVITILSFGFKYGIPADSDLVFDVRFIPNPFYIPELKALSGNDKEVSDFVMAQKESSVFLEKLYDMTSFLMPCYVAEGKNQLVISIGCTGGRHRSVTLANELSKALRAAGNSTAVYHRDIGANM